MISALRHAGLTALILTASLTAAHAVEPAIGYEAIVEVPGDHPRNDSYVRVNYTITLTDGTVMDRTEPGYPALLSMDSLIPGLRQGLCLMTPGSRSRITIPPSLAYGDRGAGKIPPGAALVIDIELVDIHNNDNP